MTELTSIDDIETRAAAFILKRDRGELATEDRCALEAWLAADARHREAYLRLDDAWGSTAAFKTWRPLDGHVDLNVLAATQTVTPVQSRSRWPLAFAATLLVALVSAAAWLVLGSARTPTYATQVGGYQRIPLADGSVLQLNTNSKVRIKFGEALRQVHLVRGEAYFEIAHDARRPFDVIAGRTTVRAVGTAFSVRLWETKRVEVVVAEGQVVLRSEGDGREQRLSAPAATAPDNPLIAAGEIAESVPSGVVLTSIASSEINRRLAWQSGHLVFRRETLARVVAEFNRYNERQIEIADPALASLEVGGNFKSTDLESFAATMRRTLDIEVDESGATIRLHRK